MKKILIITIMIMLSACSLKGLKSDDLSIEEITIDYELLDRGLNNLQEEKDG